MPFRKLLPLAVSHNPLQLQHLTVSCVGRSAFCQTLLAERPASQRGRPHFLDGHRRPRLHRGAIISRFRVALSENFLGQISWRAREAKPLVGRSTPRFRAIRHGFSYRNMLDSWGNSAFNSKCTENMCFPLPQQTSADQIKSIKTQGMPRFGRLSVLGLSAYVGNLAVSLLRALMRSSGLGFKEFSGPTRVEST